MNRRTVLAAPAAIATSTALPAVALGATLPTDIDYDAIRERIALVCEAFNKSTFGFPEPMPAGEAQAAMAMTDAEIDELGALARFAHRWGVSLDWLIKGDVGSLIHDGRQLREREQAERADLAAIDSDPAVAAYKRWYAAEEAFHAYQGDDDVPEDIYTATTDALAALADTVATTTTGLEGQLRAAFDAFGHLPAGGDFRNPDDYGFENWTSNLDGRLLRSLLEGTARLVSQSTGAPVSYVRSPNRMATASDVAEPDELLSFFKGLDRDEKEMALRIARPLANGDRSAAEAAYRAWAAERGRPINEGALAALRGAA